MTARQAVDRWETSRRTAKGAAMMEKTPSMSEYVHCSVLTSHFAFPKFSLFLSCCCSTFVVLLPKQQSVKSGRRNNYFSLRYVQSAPLRDSVFNNFLALRLPVASRFLLEIYFHVNQKNRDLGPRLLDSCSPVVRWSGGKLGIA